MLVGVYGDSNFGADPAYAKHAWLLGAESARRGIGLVYGGARVGMMGVLADAALAGKGEVIGVIPRDFSTFEIAHDGLTTIELVESMHARKARMIELAAGFIALPGGFGTLDEVFEILTLESAGVDRRLSCSSTSTAITTTCSRSSTARWWRACCAAATALARRAGTVEEAVDLARR